MLDLTDVAITAWSGLAGAENVLPPAKAEDPGSHGSVSTALARLGHLLDRRLQADPTALCESLRAPDMLADLRTVLGQAGPRHTLRVIAWLAEEVPDGTTVATDLIDHPSPNSVGRLLAESQRASLLERLFSPGRLKALEEACANAVAVREAA